MLATPGRQPKPLSLGASAFSCGELLRTALSEKHRPRKTFANEGPSACFALRPIRSSVGLERRHRAGFPGIRLDRCVRRPGS
jgi:hypothetical protein